MKYEYCTHKYASKQIHETDWKCIQDLMYRIAKGTNIYYIVEVKVNYKVYNS